MSTLTKIINALINGKNNFCCLCLKIEQNITLQSEAYKKFEQTGHSLPDMLQTIFSNDLQIQEYWSAFETICEPCFQIILGIYTFIQTSQNNISTITKALDNLYSDLTFKDVGKNSKTLFVSVNNLNCNTSKLIFDNKVCHSDTEALKRYQLCNTPKYRKIENSMNNWNKKTADSFRMKTEDLIYDLNEEIPRCKKCLKPFPSVLNLRTHFVKVHASKDHKCPKCLKAYSLPSLVTRHLAIEHCEIVCSECGKVFTNKSSYVRHELTHKLRIVCPSCGRAYKSNSTYKKHIDFNVCEREKRADPVDAKYTCDYCGKKYTQKMSLRVHIQYNHGNYKAHVCKWCGKKFSAQSRLNAHIVKHTKEKKFTCSICQGKFVTKESLLYHTRLHTGEKPYRCSKCDCTFISSSRRAYHMRAYHLQPVEECEICKVKFTSRKYLDKHMKSHKQWIKLNKSNSKLKGATDDQKNNFKEQRILTNKSKTLPSDVKVKEEISHVENIMEKYVFVVE